MDMEEIVDSYIAARNRRDMKGVLALMHEGAAYYDAFWRESCVGSDLAQYLEDWFQLGSRCYQRISGVTLLEDAVTYRYSAHEENDFENSPSAYEGAAVLVIRAGKILTISDFYCSPDPDDLLEVSRLAQKRHGEFRYAHAGLGAKQSSIVRKYLGGMIHADAGTIFANLTVSELAAQIGCSVQQLFQVVTAEFNHSLNGSIKQHDAVRVSDLLQGIAVT